MYQFFSQYKYLCTFQRHIWTTWIKHCLATINEVMFLQCFEHVQWWEFPRVSWTLLSLLYKNQECTELLWIPPNYRGLCELKRISHDKLTDILSSNRVVLLSPENAIKCNFFFCHLVYLSAFVKAYRRMIILAWRNPSGSESPLDGSDPTALPSHSSLLSPKSLSKSGLNSWGQLECSPPFVPRCQPREATFTGFCSRQL